MEDKNKEIIEKDISVNGLAIELLQEVKAQTKRWMIAFFIVVFLWAISLGGTIAGFIWYLNQYDFSSTVEQTGIYTLSDSQGNVISSDPDMTREGLIYELDQCHYSAVGLIITWQNSEKQAV